jgi:hypothetical protein
MIPTLIMSPPENLRGRATPGLRWIRLARNEGFSIARVYNDV